MTKFNTPRCIVLASDLSARCDRALGRADLLARNWSAKLIIAHAVHPAEIAHRDRLTSNVPSWRRPQSWVQVLERDLSADLSAEGIDAISTVLVGSTVEKILQLVDDEAAELVILGIAKDARMDRLQLGSTADALIRRSRVPVLNVRGRARTAYRHVVVATDFSEPSLQALQLAAHWFEGVRLTLFHAYSVPGSPLPAAAAPSESWRTAIQHECDAHLAKAALPPVVGLKCVLEQGAPEALLGDFVASSAVDLVVLGSHGRSGFSRAMLGSTAENLLHALDCDTLVVRGG